MRGVSIAQPGVTTVSTESSIWQSVTISKHSTGTEARCQRSRELNNSGSAKPNPASQYSELNTVEPKTTQKSSILTKSFIKDSARPQLLGAPVSCL